MNMRIAKPTAPEECELLAKQKELDELSQVLAEKELAINDIHLSVARFQHRYFAEVGKKYAHLDDLRAQIAEARSRLVPQDANLEQAARIAREEAAKSAEDYHASETEPVPSEADVPESTKKLYRRIAALVHPDKGTDDRSRELRTRLMAELSKAYAQGDVARMQAILAEWEHSPDAVSGDGVGAELVRTIRAIAQVRRRIAAIEETMTEIAESDVYKLMLRVHKADQTGRNILQEMSKSLDSRIGTAQAELQSLRQ